MFKSFDFMMWIDSRRCDQKEDLKEVDYDFVLMSLELEKDYEAFKMLYLKNDIYLPESEVLHCFYDQYKAENMPDIIHKFGKSYFRMIQKDVDEFFLWMKQIQECDLDTGGDDVQSVNAETQQHHTVNTCDAHTRYDDCTVFYASANI